MKFASVASSKSCVKHPALLDLRGETQLCETESVLGLEVKRVSSNENNCDRAR